jgi:polyisoprenoid-binding protein YceI
MIARYRLDPRHSRFTVQAFATGMLSMLAHSPTFAVKDFAGEIRLDPHAPDGASLQITVRADSLEVLDRVSPADRKDIEGRMRQEVLETPAFQEIRLEAENCSARRVAPDEYRLHIPGRLSLRGITLAQEFDADLLVYDDGVRLRGEFPLRLSDFRVRPVTALGGTIKLKDELRVAFDFVAWKEGQPEEKS